MIEETALQVVATNMPVMSMEAALKRRNALVEFVKKMMVENIDYGTIPGTDKPTLLKPGAEKLTTFFGLTPIPEIIESITDWTGEGHGGEPFFYFHYRMGLWQGERLVAKADGSCNSRESKYRYRMANRVCPHCGKDAIIKGKQEYGGGYICFGKKGGCGAKFSDDDPAITSQAVGRVVNPDIADVVNTIKKQASKRALVAVTLLGVNASEFFTQDLEDLVVEGTYSVDSKPANEPKPAPAPQPKPEPKPDVPGHTNGLPVNRPADPTTVRRWLVEKEKKYAARVVTEETHGKMLGLMNGTLNGLLGGDLRRGEWVAAAYPECKDGSTKSFKVPRTSAVLDWLALEKKEGGQYEPTEKTELARQEAERMITEYEQLRGQEPLPFG